MSDHKMNTGENVSLTAYIVHCLGKTFLEFPQMNAIRKGRKLIVPDNVTIGVLVERKVENEVIPENYGIRNAQLKTYREINNEIRAVQNRDVNEFESLSGASWINLIPSFLFRAFVKVASKSLIMLKRYGTAAVTSIGMFARKDQATWPIPLVGGATVCIAVGGIVERLQLINGKVEPREHLCLTITFNHDIVDGSPAARFAKRFSEFLSSGDSLSHLNDIR